MAYKVAIDSANPSSSNDYMLLISNYMQKRLNDLGVDNFLVRENSNSLTDEQRSNLIKNKYGNGNNVIVISNRNTNGSVINVVYPLRSNSKLASSIASNLEDVTNKEARYYQLRNSTNTALDDDYLIRNTPNNLTIVIDYGNVDYTNYENIAESVVKAIANFTGVNYLPTNLENYYIVQKGDSLWSIASKKGTTVSNLRALNNLKTDTLQIGQVLKLYDTSEVPTNNVTYTVQKGDTIFMGNNE